MSRKVPVLGFVLMVAFGLIVLVTGTLASSGDTRAADLSAADPLAWGAPQADEYIVLAWNDLGMHCYNRDFQYIAILPPANTLWVQVIKVADPPQIITTGLTVTYEIVDNTFSVGKTNFWTYAKDLYGADLAPDIGLLGFGLSGTMHTKADHFVAEFIPLTEFRDSDYYSNPTNPQRYPYQLAKVEVWDAVTGAKLAESMPVAPVSTEMHCEYCHDDGGEAAEDIATGDVGLNILTLHDEENADEYPSEYPDPLVDSTPIRCSKCHASNATGSPGVADIPNLSRAMHGKHAEEGDFPNTREGCYYCHPGPETKCQRGVMSEQYGMTCIDCHGSLADVAAKQEPWLDEPRCDTVGCHPGYGYSADLLYRNATDHNGIYCEGCHDSTHAIAPSREANDRIKFIALQGTPGALRDCTVCHATEPTEVGVHGLRPMSYRIYLPLVMR